jgi:hypothetical protein
MATTRLPTAAMAADTRLPLPDAVGLVVTFGGPRESPARSTPSNRL